MLLAWTVGISRPCFISRVGHTQGIGGQVSIAEKRNWQVRACICESDAPAALQRRDGRISMFRFLRALIALLHAATTTAFSAKVIGRHGNSFPGAQDVPHMKAKPC
jgi:hypothetical protein